MSIPTIARSLALGLSMLATKSLAEDIDIFKAREQQKIQVNVLFIVDNTANWGQTADWVATASCTKKDSKFCYEREALASTIGNVDIAGLHVGMLFFAEAGESPSGGYPRYGMRPMGVAGTNNNADLVSLVNSLNQLNDKGSNAAFATAMHEAYLYFQGKSVYAGITAKSDQGTIKLGTGGTIIKNDGGAFQSFTLSPKSGTYKTVLGPETTCGTKNFVIFLSNGASDNSENGTAESLLRADGGYVSTISLTPSGSQGNWADEFARFMYASSGIQTYTIDVAPDTTGQGPGNSALLKSMAKQSNGAYYKATSADVLTQALKEVLNQIQAVNSTFTPAALPADSISRGVSLNQVYMGMFRPDKNPRWFGNLKLFEFALKDGKLVLVDSNALAIQNQANGFIADAVTSFWTYTTSPGFWNFRCADASGTPLGKGDPILCGNPISGTDAPDGAVVEKGGAGQLLRANQSTRALFTCTACTANTANSVLNTFTNSINPTAFGLESSNTAERDAIVDWVKGLDNITENAFAANGPRPSIPGDILHSAPVAVNHNISAGNCADSANLDKEVIVYYAGNDGVLHAVKGGKTGITNAGKELWGFIPTEWLAYQKRLRDNSPPITFPAPVPAGNNPALSNNKPYMIDGNLSIYAPDINRDCKPDKVWLFLTMRRGGRVIYALDVTDPTNPKFLWKKSNADSGYAELGQTWSEIRAITLADGTPALIFGAGYDPGAEDIPYQAATDTYAFPSGQSAPAKSMGRGVFIVRADNGAVLKLFGTTTQEGQSVTINDSIPSAVTVIRNPVTGLATLAYVGDTGGNVWKIALTDATGAATAVASQWTLTKVAALGGGEPLSSTDRKFLYAPDTVQIKGGYALLVGSGDREKPFEKTVQNRFFMIRDTGGSSPIECLANADSTQSDLCSAHGWYLDLGPAEKTVGSAITDGGITFFPTNTAPVDASSSCVVSLGTAKMYTVRYDTGGPSIIGGPRSETLLGGGFPPSPRITTVPITESKDGVTTTKFHKAVIAPPAYQATLPAPPFKRNIIYQYQEGLD